jgi:hypothetical protein
VRAPLSSPSVNLAGKPSRVGGVVATVVGWLILVMGGSIALGVALLFAAFEAAMVGVAVALPIAIVSLVIGIVLVRRGGSLSRAGVEAERTTREQALIGLAAHRGTVTALDAAHALGVSVAEADAVLTDLAKREPDRVAVDVDDQGVVHYLIVNVAGDVHVRVQPDDRWRVNAGEEDVEVSLQAAEPKKEAGA